MRLLLRLAVMMTLVNSGLILLGLGFGHRALDTVIAYTESCDIGGGLYSNKLYIADWLYGLQFMLSEQGVSNLPPTWSPDGQSLAYSVDIEGDYAIDIRHLNTGSVNQLTGNPNALDMAPSWSPNGHSIAFFSDGFVALYDTVTGTTHRSSIHIANNVLPEAWSPNGQLIAISGFYPNTAGDIFILHAETEEIDNLTHDQFDMVARPAWSPDGRYLTFTASQFPTSSIYIADLQTGVLSPLTKQDNSNYVGSAWSPDGQTIAAITDTSEVHLLNLKGEVIERLNFQHIPGIGGGEGKVGWSPDGNYLTFYVPINYMGRNYAFQLASRAIYPLTRGICNESNAVWKPPY